MRRRFRSVSLIWGLFAVLSGAACSDPGPPEAESRFRVPTVVPCLDARPAAVDREGSARIEPSGPFPVDSVQDFRVAFTAGTSGIAPGGFVLLQISPWWGWTPPQDEFPSGPGYIRVEADFKSPKLKTVVLPLNRVLVWPGEGGIPPGGEVFFEYKRAKVDRFAEAAELFQIFVDADGDGHSAPVEPSPAVEILAAAAVRLQVNCPSILAPGEPARVEFAGLDGVGNWGILPGGIYTLAATREGAAAGAETLEVKAPARTGGFDFILGGEGIYFFTVSGPGGLSGKSNVLWCRSGESSRRLYFGDIHGHSRVSDGTGIPADFYRYAREVSGLRIAALTDHSDYGTVQVPGKVWEELCRAAEEAYRPGEFVTFAAFEWTNWVYGHRNVYYRDACGPVWRSIDPESDTPQKLWKLLEPYEAMTAAHHPGGGPVPTDWSVPPGEKEFFVEISSIHGVSESYGDPDCIYRPVQGAFVLDALARGYRLGLIGGGDTHDGHPGQRSQGAAVTGIMGVWAEELTRESVWEELKARRVYATTGPKIILNFRIADFPMGSEASWNRDSGPLPLAYQAVGCAPLARVEIIRSGEVVFSRPGQGVLARGLLEDPFLPAEGAWYLLKVVQEDGNMAWSSPVWVSVPAIK